MKKQIVVIHGGDTFDTYERYISFLKNFEIDDINYFKGKNWKGNLVEKLGEDFEVIAPRMPNKINAKYLEWKIWFEKLIPLLNEEVTLIGHSLGGIFLAKYLSENDFPKKIKGTFLVAAPYDKISGEDSLADFILSENLNLLQKQGGRIFLYHSKDDDVVPFANIEKYAKALPRAEKVVFEDKEHFNQEEFSELVESIKKCYN